MGPTLQRHTVDPPSDSGLRGPAGGALNEHIRADHTELTLRLKQPLWRLWEQHSDSDIISLKSPY